MPLNTVGAPLLYYPYQYVIRSRRPRDVLKYVLANYEIRSSILYVTCTQYTHRVYVATLRARARATSHLFYLFSESTLTWWFVLSSLALYFCGDVRCYDVYVRTFMKASLYFCTTEWVRESFPNVYTSDVRWRDLFNFRWTPSGGSPFWHECVPSSNRNYYFLSSLLYTTASRAFYDDGGELF